MACIPLHAVHSRVGRILTAHEADLPLLEARRRGRPAVPGLALDVELAQKPPRARRSL